MLLLVFAHRHQVGVIQEDVGGHQHRVIEQAYRHLVALLHSLLLELNHPLQPVERSHAVQQPAQLAVGRHMALNEHGGLGGIDATGQIQGRRAAGVGRQLLRVVGNRDRMQVHHTKKGVVAVLKVHPVADGAEPVAQMQRSGGLNP